MARRRTVIAAILLGAGALGVTMAPAIAERRMNGVVEGPARPVSPAAAALHERLTIVDMHADSLLWGRDLLRRGRTGHVDLPRLQEGNVALVAFTVVTKTPRGQNIERNDDTTDNIKTLAILSRWPPRTWGSLKERALYQAERLRDMQARSGGRLTLLKDGAAVDAFLAARKADPRTVAGFLGLEGAHALEGDLANLDALYAAGYRMIAPTHFFDNELGGSAHGMQKGGLTPLGRKLIPELERRGMILDLAHASAQTIEDALSLARRPVVVSHTGVRGTCDNGRNLSDAQLRGVAATGGVVGIGYWETAVCGTDPAAIARSIAHAVKVAGADHVSLGSDFDGAVTTPFDASGMARLTQALLDAGLDEGTIATVMGGNAVRVLREGLRPQAAPGGLS